MFYGKLLFLSSNNINESSLNYNNIIFYDVLILRAHKYNVNYNLKTKV